jgi:hypothetical protein
MRGTTLPSAVRWALTRLLLLVSIAALAVLGAGAAQAAVVTNTTFPTSGVLVGCTEAIAYSGQDHLVVRVTSDASGGFYDAIHRNIQVTGIGLTTGTSYVLNAETNENEHFVGASNFTVVLEEVFVSQGPLPNANVRIIEHMTIDANGDITSDTFDFNGNCRG